MERTRIGRQRSAFIWHVLPGASNFDIKRLIKEYLNGQTPESFDERIKFMSMFNDIEWTKKGDSGNLFAQCQRSGSICDPSQARTLVLPRARVRKYVDIPTNLKEHGTLSHCRWLTSSSVTLPTRCVQQQSSYRLDS